MREGGEGRGGEGCEGGRREGRGGEGWGVREGGRGGEGRGVREGGRGGEGRGGEGCEELQNKIFILTNFLCQFCRTVFHVLSHYLPVEYTQISPLIRTQLQQKGVLISENGCPD